MAEPFVRGFALDLGGVDLERFPFSLAAVRALDGLALAPGVTFFVGENGSGKSTLVEAIAVAAGMNAEGGGRNFAFANRPSESALADHLRLVRGARRPRTDFFLRAESFFNVATAVDELDELERGRQLASYGGRSLHEQSHGESFLALVNERFTAGGFYVLDEPEAALSVRGQLALLARMADLTTAGAQFVVATHSPILTALPGALILSVDDEGLTPTAYTDTEPYRLTRSFLEAPQRFLRHLLAE